ncbi:MAG: biotin--[acetyl-CoA-carboxylase] ligase [Rhodanobacteraceae bacterium]
MPTTYPDTSTARLPSSDAAGRSPAPPRAPAVLTLLGTGTCCSGPELARRLGISTSTVRRQVAALRAAGLDVRTGRRGYRLTRPLDWLDPAAIVAGLPEPVRVRVGVLENHWRVDSTSSECLRRALELPNRSFVFADWQVAGRGRRGRDWISPPGVNLQVSCFKRFAGGYAALSGLSLAAGIAAAEALGDCGVVGVGLKWPNDLVHDDAKLGGILVELGGDSAGPCHAVIGIGINVRVPESVKRRLARPCADVAGLVRSTAPSRNALAAALVARLVETLDAFGADGFSAFAAAWAGHDALVGRRVRVEGARGAFEGVAEGVDVRGALRVRCPDGVRDVDSADVTVRAT